MPSSTSKQARTMAAAAHDPAFARKMGIPAKVAVEFNQADKGTGIIRPKRRKKSHSEMATTMYPAKGK